MTNLAAVSDTTLATITVFVTLLSGYLAVAYVAGPKLSPFQVMFISALFVVFSLVMAAGTYTMAKISIAIPPGVSGPVARATPFALLAVELAAIVGALAFMRDVRKKDPQNNA